MDVQSSPSLPFFVDYSTNHFLTYDYDSFVSRVVSRFRNFEIGITIVSHVKNILTYTDIYESPVCGPDRPTFNNHHCRKKQQLAQTYF